MNWQSISPILRIGLCWVRCAILPSSCGCSKKKKLTVRYSIIWLISAGVLLVFAVFPYVVLVLMTDLLGMAVPLNVVFLLVSLRVHPFAFAAQPFKHRLRLRGKIKRLAQEKTPSSKKARAQTGSAARGRRISKRKTKNLVTRRPKAATACQKRCAFPAQTAYDQGLLALVRRATAAFGGRFALHMPRH